MIAKIIAWFLELFRKKPKEQKQLEDKIEKLEEDLEEIDEKKLSSDDINDILG